MRTLSVRHVRQKTDYWCGPAVLEMLLAHEGVRADQKSSARSLRTNKSYGTTRSRFGPVIRRYGLHPDIRRFNSLSDIARHLKAGRPVMVNYFETRDPAGPYGHFSLVVGMTGKDVIFNDPTFGKGYRIERAQFTNMWKRRDFWMLTIGKKPKNPAPVRVPGRD